MYSKKAIERFTHPRFMGEIAKADGVGQEGNMKCGDIMKFYLKVKNNKIEDVKFQTYGCGAAIASTDVICELVKGKTIEQAEKLTYDKVVKELGEIPLFKVHCSVLGLAALKKAIADYKAKAKRKKDK